MELVLRLLVWFAMLGLAQAQCPFGGGDIAASVIIPLLIAAMITIAVFVFLWKKRMIVFCPGRNLFKSKEGNGATGQRVSNHGEAYSNPGFVDDMEVPAEVAMEEGHGGLAEGFDAGKSPKDKKHQSPKKGGQKGSPVSQQTASSKSKTPPKGFEFTGKNLTRMVSTTSLDDTFLNKNSEVVSVCLQSQDFIGLGFNIQGSMRDGIRVSQVHNRGPAIESGKITAGDRIQSVTISFEKMVYEDALTILSYASPYPVKITLQKNGQLVPDRRSASDLNTQLNHPIYRSQSLDALTGIGKEPFFKKKRNFSEMKSDSHRNGHPKIHSVQLSSCNEGEIRHSQEKPKWGDINLPEFQEGKYSDEGDNVFSDADKLFNDAKRNAERKEAEIKVKGETIEASPIEVSLNASAEKTDTSLFDVTAGSLSTLDDSYTPSDTLENVSVSLNDTPVTENVQKVESTKSDMAKAAMDFDAMFSKMETDKEPSDNGKLKHNFDKNLNFSLEDSKDSDSRDGRTVNLFDVQLEMDAAESRIDKAADDFVDARESLATEAEVRVDSLHQKRLEVKEGIVPVVQSSKLNSALEFDDKQDSVDEDDIVPESRKKAFDIESHIEFEDVKVEVEEGDEKDLSDVTEKLKDDMLRDSSSVEASVSQTLTLDTDPVEEDSLEAVSVRRDSSNDKIYGASLRESRSLFQDESADNDEIVADVVTPAFAAPRFTALSRSKVNSSSDDEEISADEGEYKIQTQTVDDVEVSHDLSAEDLKSFKVQMMADKTYHVEASSGDVIKDLHRANSDEESEELTVRPITRAVSYDIVLGGHESKPSGIEDRPGSFKSEKKGHSDSGFLDWSGKRLVRSGSFSEIPGVDGKEGEDRDWTFNNNIDDESMAQELKKYKNYQDLRGSDSEPEEQSGGLIRTKIYQASANLADLSDNNSAASTRSSSPVTANGGHSDTHTSSQSSHFVSKSYHISTVDTSGSDGSGLELGKYTLSVRHGSDGEESDSMA